MTLLKGMLLIAVLYLAGLALLFGIQRSLVFRPNHARPAVATAGVPGLSAVKISTTDGLALLAWYRPPAPGEPTLLYFHGNGGSLSDRVSRVRRFGQTGWGLLFLDYRGYGGNPGQPSEEGLAFDASGAVAYLARQGISARQLIFYGESLGTGVAVRLAGEHQPAAIILEAPYTSIADIAQARFWYVPVGLLLKDPFRLMSRLPSVQAPLLVILGERDQVVPPAMSHAVFEAANTPKQLWTAPLGNHHDLMSFGAAEAAIRFVEAHLPGR